MAAEEMERKKLALEKSLEGLDREKTAQEEESWNPDTGLWEGVVPERQEEYRRRKQEADLAWEEWHESCMTWFEEWNQEEEATEK